MKRVLERLNKKLIMEYFNEYETGYVGKTYLLSLLVLVLLTVVPAYLFKAELMLVACIFLVDIGISNLVTNRKVISEYERLRQNKLWFRKFKGITHKYRTDMLYNGYITKAEFDAFLIYEKIEKAELELVEFEKNEERLKSLAFKELTYSLDLIEELDNMPEEERIKEINRIMKKERMVVQTARA